MYIKKALPILKNNIKICSDFLGKYRIYDLEILKQESPEVYHGYDYRELLLDGDICVNNWGEQWYEKNTLHKERLIHKSEQGLMTRSKSESMIASKLEALGIQFRYDCVERFGNTSCSPDFEIIHPKQRRVIYWEHFGMMDDPGYVKSTMRKLCLYGDNGIYVGDNLIVTWETKEKPLQYEQMNERIRKQLLN